MDKVLSMTKQLNDKIQFNNSRHYLTKIKVDPKKRTRNMSTLPSILGMPTPETTPDPRKKLKDKYYNNIEPINSHNNHHSNSNCKVKLVNLNQLKNSDQNLLLKKTKTKSHVRIGSDMGSTHLEDDLEDNEPEPVKPVEKKQPK